MITVNLEKTLIRENKQEASSSELLLIREFEKLNGIDETLNRVGLGGALNAGKYHKDRINNLRSQAEPFDQTRVFHVSQIKAICDKYHLRFLNTHYYRGSLDKELPRKISEFEKEYNVSLGTSNAYIMAPKQSFALEEKPKDPLLFYKINEDYYYLIHKWGNDLSAFRRVLPILAHQASITVLAIFVFVMIKVFLPQEFEFLHILTGAVGFAFTIMYIGFNASNGFKDTRGIIKRNEWDSTYL